MNRYDEKLSGFSACPFVENTESVSEKAEHSLQKNLQK